MYRPSDRRHWEGLGGRALPSGEGFQIQQCNAEAWIAIFVRFRGEGGGWEWNLRSSFRKLLRTFATAPNVAKLNAVVYSSTEQVLDRSLVVDGRCTISVVGESTAFKMIAAHQHGACEASPAPQLLHW